MEQNVHLSLKLLKDKTVWMVMVLFGGVRDYIKMSGLLYQDVVGAEGFALWGPPIP